ncbi:MAG: hypothetical protein KKB30_01910 [Proteobacteria bacterium]|nr:hypothetical protein [Pseudomonadota bacterium]MBU1716350.1 hypothetical protein [Pseudomonadota bacterium]
MDGSYEPGLYNHPTLGLIKIFLTEDNWVYQCYTQKGTKALSNPRPLDVWTWALSEPKAEDEE